MPFTLTMPKLSPTMETGVIAKWLKKPGEFVNAGDVLMEVSTDKATVEHTALDEGYLRKILVQEGSDAKVNQPIAIFSEDASEDIKNYAPEEIKESKEPIKKEVRESKPQVSEKSFPSRVVASPLAKKIASEKGIDLTKLQGSGPRGRIVVKDLEKGTPKTFKKTSSAPTQPAGTYEEIALTPIRKVIAERLQAAKASIPHFYVTQTIDAENFLNLRDQLKKLEIEVTINDLIIKAVSLTLKAHPEVNSGFNDQSQTILRYQTIDISVAVNAPTGLITPIITHADTKSIQEISDEMRTLAKKAKEGKLAPHEFQGGSFTISNMGMVGVTTFAGIINPPQAAILSVAGILDQPVVKNNAIVPGKVMNLTLSVDHRVVDGVAAAQFLQSLKTILENPISLLL